MRQCVVEQLLALRVLAHERVLVTVQVTAQRAEVAQAGVHAVGPKADPRVDLRAQGGIARVLRIRARRGQELLEECLDLVDVGNLDAAVLNLGPKGVEHGLDRLGLAGLERHAATLVPLHVLGQYTERVGGVGVGRGIVVHEAERVAPHLVGMVVARPVVPREVSVEEDAHLAGLGLLHGVDHAAHEGTGRDVGAECVLVAAHGQVVARVVRARPVDPHEGSNARAGLEGVDSGLIRFAPHLLTGCNDTDVLGQCVVPRAACTSVVVLVLDKRNRVLEARVLERTVLVLHLLQVMQPVRQIRKQTLVVVRTRAVGIVGAQHDLAAACIDDLQVLCLERREIALIRRAERDWAVHERVQRVHEAALGLVTRLCQLRELGDLLGGVKIAPLRVVLGIVLGRVDVGVLLEEATPAHELHAVLGAPRVAVVALDEAARLDVRPVVHRESGKRTALDLLEHLVQRAQAIEGGIGVTTNDDDAGRSVLALGQNRDEVGVRLLEQIGLRSYGAALHELVDRALGAVDANEHLDSVGVLAWRINLVGLDLLESQDVVQALLGLGIDTGVEHHVDGFGQGHLALAVLDGVRGWVHLVGLGGKRRRRRRHERQRRTGSEHEPTECTSPHALCVHTHSPFYRDLYKRAHARALLYSSS